MSHKLWNAVFSVSVSSMYIFISLKTSSVTHGLFRSGLFTVQMFRDFLLSFFYINIYLISLSSENITYMISVILNFVKVCFMTQNMVCLGQRSIYIWKEYMFCCYWVECSINVSQNQVLDSVFYFYILDFPSTISISYWERDVEISKYNCGFV